METFLIKAAQLVVALAFLVIIHEFGHYIIARAFGIKVEKFYLFFNPWFSLAKWKPKKKSIRFDKNGNEKASWRDTEYGIGWLPLGGYVKIAGMIDESMDKEQLAKPAQPWEFRSKEAYKRLLVMLGGVIFNFILAIIIYAGIAWHWGNKYIPFDKAYEGMDFVPAAQEIGFRNGDIPLTADGEKIDASNADFMYHMAAAKEVKVLRNHTDTVTINVPKEFILKLNESEEFLSYRIPAFIARLQPGEAAEKAGMKEGDRIVAVGNTPTPSFTELTPALLEHAGKECDITVMRDSHTCRNSVGNRQTRISDNAPDRNIPHGLCALQHYRISAAGVGFRHRHPDKLRQLDEICVHVRRGEKHRRVRSHRQHVSGKMELVQFLADNRISVGSARFHEHNPDSGS